MIRPRARKRLLILSRTTARLSTWCSARPATATSKRRGSSKSSIRDWRKIGPFGALGSTATTSYPLRFRARASRPSPHPTSRTRAGGRGSMDLTHASVDIQEDGGFVADRPGIVSGRNHKGVAGLQLTFRAIAADDFQPPLEHVSDVTNLTAIGLRHRLDVLRPPPTGLVVQAEDTHVTELHDLCLALGEDPRFVGGIKPLLVNGGPLGCGCLCPRPLPSNQS